MQLLIFVRHSANVVQEIKKKNIWLLELHWTTWGRHPSNYGNLKHKVFFFYMWEQVKTITIINKWKPIAFKEFVSKRIVLHCLHFSATHLILQWISKKQCLCLITKNYGLKFFSRFPLLNKLLSAICTLGSCMIPPFSVGGAGAAGTGALTGTGGGANFLSKMFMIRFCNSFWAGLAGPCDECSAANRKYFINYWGNMFSGTRHYKGMSQWMLLAHQQWWTVQIGTRYRCRTTEILWTTGDYFCYRIDWLGLQILEFTKC
jgi:hypothetical protein